MANRILICFLMFVVCAAAKADILGWHRWDQPSRRLRFRADRVPRYAIKQSAFRAEGVLNWQMQPRVKGALGLGVNALEWQELATNGRIRSVALCAGIVVIL